MSYFVISTGDWGIPMDVFVQQMRSRWPTVIIREITSPEGSTSPESNFCLDFDLTTQYSRIDGSLHRTGRSFHFDSDIRDAAQLALWFRSLAPDSVPLVFCDDSMSGMLDLEPGTTEADIFRAFDYIPAPPGWMNYVIIARQGWGMQLKVLAPRIQEHWPAARIVENEDPDSRWRFEFNVPMTHSQVSGRFSRKISSMDFTGDVRDSAEFALWCRSVVPTDQLLLTCDKGSLYLEADTTAEELIKTFSTEKS